MLHTIHYTLPTNYIHYLLKKTMKRILFALVILLAAGVSANAQQPKVSSPDGRLVLRFELRDSVPYYSLYRDGKAVVLPSKMGFELEWRDDLAHAFVLKDVDHTSFDETWTPVWGEESEIRNNYNEMAITLKQKSGKVMIIRFRLYDDGLGFRYEFPAFISLKQSDNQTIKQSNALVCFWFKEELTEFVMAGDHTAWWIP